MDALIQAGERSYYLDWPSKVGIVLLDDGTVCLIDSGNSKDAGRKVLSVCKQREWQISHIVNTHSHADHIGGNALIQDRTGCRIFAAGLESAFVNFPLLEPALLYGGLPPGPLRRRTLMAQPSFCSCDPADCPKGLELIPLPGHSPDMVGVRTPDDVLLVGDAVFSREVIEKYHVFFLQDVAAFLETLRRLEETSARLFLPSHGRPQEDLSELIALNRNKVEEILALLRRLCDSPQTFEGLLGQLFSHYRLTMNFDQYVLIGSTLRTYLAFLLDCGEVTVSFEEQSMLWYRVKGDSQHA